MTSGFPDWFTKTQPARTIARTGQTPVSVQGEASITATSNATLPLYVVPAGYTLYAATGIAYCEASVLQKWEWLDDATIVAAGYFDVIDSVAAGDLGAVVIASGHTLSVKVYNNDSSNRIMGGVMLGTLIQE